MKTRVRTTSRFIVKPENKVVVCNMSMAEVMTKNCAAVEEIEVNHVKKLSE